MPFINRGHSPLEMTNGRPLCPRCRARMWSFCVQPDRKTFDNDRTLRCPRCEHLHTDFRYYSKSKIEKVD
jgi:hypothetical protein